MDLILIIDAEILIVAIDQKRYLVGLRKEKQLQTYPVLLKKTHA